MQHTICAKRYNKFVVSSALAALFAASTVYAAGEEAGAKSGSVSAAPAAAAHASAPAASAAPAAPAAHPTGEAVHTQPTTPPVETTKTETTRSPNTTREPTGTGTHEHPEHDHDRRNTNGQVYVDTGWPFYGTGYGWDNSGNYNNGNYNNNNQPAVTNSAPAEPTAPIYVPSQADSSSSSVTAAGAQAQVANAVDKSPAVTAANSGVQMAQSAYNSERERVLTDLRKTPAYQQALARRQNASHDVHAAKAGDAGSDSVMNAATAKLDAGDEVTKMEEEAVAADPTAAAAKARLEQASVDRDGLRSQLVTQTHSTVH